MKGLTLSFVSVLLESSLIRFVESHIVYSLIRYLLLSVQTALRKKNGLASKSDKEDFGKKGIHNRNRAYICANAPSMMSVPRLIPCLVVNDALQHPVMMMMKGTGKGKSGASVCVFVKALPK